MAVVWIPPLMRDLTRGQHKVEVPGGTLAQVVNNLEREYPGLKERICEDDQIKPELAIAVDGVITQLGLLERVGEDSEVHILPAIGGGSV